MCTSLNYKTKNNYFGRNLDLEYTFNEKVIITPRGYLCRNFKTKYAIIGMSTVVDDYPLYADATNEYGLSMAGLYFPNNAYYFDRKENHLNLASYELIPYFLGLYKSVSELKDSLKILNITNENFKEGINSSSLHWMISDKYETIVLEQTKEGLKIYDNPYGVLTNNPPFSYHLENINNYLNLSSKYLPSTFANGINLTHYGVGLNAYGLPGDTSPASRFIRCCFNKFNSISDEDEVSSITEFFHILDSVAMTRGSTYTKDGKLDITNYSCCINTDDLIYYYKTYNNNQITAIKMTEEKMNRNYLTIYELVDKQQINYID